jgi:aminoglycoside 6'-N-acetyltransferase I
MRVDLGTVADLEEWTRLRHALWPDAEASVHREEIASILRDPSNAAGFLCRDQDGSVLGFAEVALRHDYVNGCQSSPVGFLEGIFVQPASRGRGAARALCHAAEQWVRSRHCMEFASDTNLSNLAGQKLHAALGFVETERVVFYRKVLTSE